MFNIVVITLYREISIQGKGDGTTCAVNNQLWAWLFISIKNYLPIHQQPILQLVDDCTRGIVSLPCIEISLLFVLVFIAVSNPKTGFNTDLSILPFLYPSSHTVFEKTVKNQSCKFFCKMFQNWSYFFIKLVQNGFYFWYKWKMVQNWSFCI